MHAISKYVKRKKKLKCMRWLKALNKYAKKKLKKNAWDDFNTKMKWIC